MVNQTRRSHFFLVILAGTSLLSFFIFRPFLYALILAIVFTVVFQTLHQKILAFTGNNRGLAALATTIAIVMFIMLPLIFVIVQILQEAQQAYYSLTEGTDNQTILTISKKLTEDFQKFFPAIKEFSIDINQYLKQGLSWLVQHLGTVFSSVIKMIVSAFIFIVALYYLLKDGDKLKKGIVALSPLADIDDETIFKKLELAVSSVVRGNLTIAFIQGILTTIGFTVFGVPNAVLWGTVAAVAALIPGIGTALVLTPAIIYLFISGDLFSAFGLLAWGMLAVGLVDNLLGPKLLGRGMELHPLVVFLSVLGGIGFFGPIGFLLGPLTLSLLFALLDIYPSLVEAK